MKNQNFCLISQNHNLLFKNGLTNEVKKSRIHKN